MFNILSISNKQKKREKSGINVHRNKGITFCWFTLALFLFLCSFSLLYFLLWPVKYTFTRETSRYDPNYCVTAGLRGSFLFDYEKRSLKQELLGHDKRSNLWLQVSGFFCERVVKHTQKKHLLFLVQGTPYKLGQ